MKKIDGEEEILEGDSICPKCGSIMVDENGKSVCPHCDGEIDFFGDESDDDNEE